MTLLQDCRYRHSFLNTSQYFVCRHSKMHSAGDIVNAAVCNACNLRDTPCENIRPEPKHSVLRPPLPFAADRLQYVSLEQLVADVRDMASKLPTNLSAVAGIPRSGMIPAALLASHLHLPLFELSSAYGLRALGCGARLEGREHHNAPLLVVDDSVATGAAMADARLIIEQSKLGQDALYAAVYVTPEAGSDLDIIGREAPSPHLFEWNLFNCNFTTQFAFDFDGVLCEDWRDGDDCGAAYREFLHNAHPLWLPRRSPIRLIVTARLEKHRALTEQWLARYGVRVQRLVMGPWESADERANRYNAGEFKGRAYADSDCWLFIESDEQQAYAIFAASGKPVLCPRSGTIFQ